MLARCLLILLVCLLSPSAAVAAAADGSEQGEHAVGYRSIKIERQDGTAFWAWVFYPADAHEQDAALIEGDDRFPVVSFGHGFLQPVQRYRYSLRFLASHGYIVIATNSHRGIAPDHAQYSRDLALCLTHLIELGRDDSSWLAGRVNADALALSGHSMGGGASVRATSSVRVQALITLAGAPLRTGPTRGPGNPPAQLHIVGDADRIVPPGATRGLFADLDGPRLFASIAGGSHCGFMDETIPGCDKGSIDHEEQLRISRSLMLAFLDLYLKGDERHHGALWDRHPLEESGVLVMERREVPDDDDQ